ncbi:MmcQ/YjbR family DNA-binding protein [Actinomycetospora endophytica]|uniref:MmcQ/YjbR family DNA-binding protein n=1 Tax=Actinomycetospora endophytica TaxID=2291215 RepID=A0ABS8PGG9_9PSEU|nr:MmcQ/YjbR family DNA-binding protein [Actinomycetospora endophytica]MCD2197113.1 MmcQ/YjbR family DNA-binding protein [Actinomycetospora endophytica]
MATRPARIDDVHALARAMPHVRELTGPKGNTVYQVGGKSFVFFRTPQRDASDPDTGERYDDVIMLWVESDEAKAALLGDPAAPYFTTPRFDGHPSVLVRGGRLGEIGLAELTELVQDAWLAQASPRRRDAWLAEHADAPAPE